MIVMKIKDPFIDLMSSKQVPIEILETMDSIKPFTAAELKRLEKAECKTVRDFAAELYKTKLPVKNALGSKSNPLQRKEIIKRLNHGQNR